ncbi:MAG: lipopolysaccharide heptosyltransferase II [Thermodesulfobacteriota bacterium]
MKLSALGDVLQALPTLEALRAAYPQARITWLVETAYAPLLQGHPALDEVWPAPRLRLGQEGAGRDLATVMRLIRRLRSQPFDLVIDLQGLLKSAIWVALAKSPRKLGYNGTREGSYLVLTERLAPYDPEAHAVWRYLNVAHYLGAPPTLPRFRLSWATDVDTNKVITIDAARPQVVLHPGARWITKLWPTILWAQLADWLNLGKGCDVIITGSGTDRPLVAAIIEQMQGKAINLAGRTSLKELAALMRQAALAVTTDTGPMHLAAALGIPVVALFGPTAPWRTGPFGEGHAIVRLELECSPCFKRRCPEPRCLTALPVETVQTACEKTLAARGIIE